MVSDSSSSESSDSEDESPLASLVQVTSGRSRFERQMPQDEDGLSDVEDEQLTKETCMGLLSKAVSTVDITTNVSQLYKLYLP